MMSPPARRSVRPTPDPQTIINPGQFSMETLGQISAEIDTISTWRHASKRMG
jgi:hypothetical protein